MLFFVGQVLDGDTEHGDVKTDTWQQSLEVANPIDVGRGNKRLHEVVLLELVVEHINSLPEVLLHLIWSHIIELKVISEGIIGAHSVNVSLPGILTFLAASYERL